MTVTKESSAPLIVVIGATGTQGGSVIRELIASDKPYRIRGITRDASKPAASQLTAKGVEMVSTSISVGHEADVRKAFEGATYVFAVTNFWEHLSKEREIAEGKLIVDAAKAVGVKLLIWSGLLDINKLSNGKYKNVDHYDGKAAVTEYAAASGVPTAVVQAGFYASNFLSMTAPRKQEDGSYTVYLPVDAKAMVLPIIDMESDYGLFVRQAIESPSFGAGSEVYSSGELISLADVLAQLSEITGKKINYQQLSDDAFKAALPFPDAVKVEVLEMFKYQEEFGYFGKKDLAASKKDLSRAPRTWAQYAKATDWSKVLA
jgi:uncharacterized protein YbjT (DUF2867 family)